MALLLLGAGGWAREVALVIREDPRTSSTLAKETFLLSDDENEWDGFRIVGSIDKFYPGIAYRYTPLDRHIHQFIAAVGSPETKEKLCNRALAKEWDLFNSVRHPMSFVGNADIDRGTVICSMCSITTNVRIGKCVNVNLNCTIGHDVVIEDFVNLSPHCTISGNVTIKRGADLGSAVTVLPGVTIGENTVVGAGAVVTKDLPDNCTAVGIPAKVIKQK